jgi:hypothetical protein
VVVRADSSGTSFVFTQHLSAISKAFAAKPGKNDMPAWSVGTRSKGNEGGTVTSLLIVHLIIGERVDAAWLLVCAGAIGAAAATVVLWLAPRIRDAVNLR